MRVSILQICTTVVIAFLAQATLAQNILPEKAGIDGLAVPQFVDCAMTNGLVVWHAQQAFIYQPEQASVQLKAQVAISVWFSQNAFNETAARRFIYDALRAACSIQYQPTLLAPNGTRHAPLSLLHEYAYTYQMNLPEIDSWWANEGQASPRVEWAHRHVRRWLNARSSAQQALALMRITRNIDPVTDRGVEGFKIWWRDASAYTRDEWVIMLIERALEQLAEDNLVPHTSYGIAKDQLQYLLPNAVYSKHGIGLPRNASEQQQRDYATQPLAPANHRALKEWWHLNKKGYRIPTESPFAEPDSNNYIHGVSPKAPIKTGNE